MHPDYSSPASIETLSFAKTRTFMAHVYNWMSLGLALTAVVALAVSNSQDTLYWLANHRMAFYGLLLLEFGMVIAFTSTLARVQYGTALAMFLSYAALNGVTFAFLFLVYTASSIATAFFIAAGTFAGASLFGTITKRNLTGMGHFMGMALWGIILAIVVNLFLQSPALSYATSMIAVIVFVGLTAYDTQRLRAMSTSPAYGDEDPYSTELGDTRKKVALSGALMLYLDFINLFVHLLRLTGNRR